MLQDNVGEALQKSKGRRQRRKKRQRVGESGMLQNNVGEALAESKDRRQRKNNRKSERMEGSRTFKKKLRSNRQTGGRNRRDETRDRLTVQASRDETAMPVLVLF